MQAAGGDPITPPATPTACAACHPRCTLAGPLRCLTQSYSIRNPGVHCSSTSPNSILPCAQLCPRSRPARSRRPVRRAARTQLWRRCCNRRRRRGALGLRGGRAPTGSPRAGGSVSGCHPWQRRLRLTLPPLRHALSLAETSPSWRWIPLHNSRWLCRYHPIKKSKNAIALGCCAGSAGANAAAMHARVRAAAWGAALGAAQRAQERLVRHAHRGRPRALWAAAAAADARPGAAWLRYLCWTHLFNMAAVHVCWRKYHVHLQDKHKQVNANTAVVLAQAFSPMEGVPERLGPLLPPQTCAKQQSATTPGGGLHSRARQAPPMDEAAAQLRLAASPGGSRVLPSAAAAMIGSSADEDDPNSPVEGLTAPPYGPPTAPARSLQPYLSCMQRPTYWQPQMLRLSDRHLQARPLMQADLVIACGLLGTGAGWSQEQQLRQLLLLQGGGSARARRRRRGHRCRGRAPLAQQRAADALAAAGLRALAGHCAAAAAGA